MGGIQIIVDDFWSWLWLYEANEVYKRRVQREEFYKKLGIRYQDVKTRIKKKDDINIDIRGFLRKGGNPTQSHQW